MKISIIGHPNSKNPRVETDASNNTHVYVREPALDGKANKAISIAVAKLYKVPNSRVKLLSGNKSKIKTFEIKNS